jgi:hypothetical protein
MTVLSRWFSGVLAAGALVSSAAAQTTAVRKSIRTVSPTREVVRLAAPLQTPAAPLKTLSRERIEQVLGRSAAELRVVRASGVSSLSPAATSVGIAPGEFVFRKMADTAKRVTAVASPDTRPAGDPKSTVVPQSSTPATSRAITQGATAFVMPYRWLTVDSAGVERVLVPFFVLTGGGLSYDVNSRTYRGVALVGVEDTLHESAGTVRLVRPLKLLLTATNGGTVTPLQLAIGHTSLAYDTISIESPDSTHLHIRTGADTAGIVIPIPIRVISVALTPVQATLQAFGLATTDISVTLPRGVARHDTATVSFSSTGAPVRPSSMQVNGATAATIHLRSGTPGPDSIRAYLDGAIVGETVVTFVAPWAFLGAMVTGLLLGGLARFFGAKRRKRASAFTRDLVRGAPFGAFAAIAGAIGFDAVNLKLDDPAALPAIVVTAALGAWLGSRLFDRAPG